MFFVNCLGGLVSIIVQKTQFILRNAKIKKNTPRKTYREENEKEGGENATRHHKRKAMQKCKKKVLKKQIIIAN